jgi:HK97 gp10 family phage protein
MNVSGAFGGQQVTITGLSEALAIFDELADEIGDKKATSKVLVPAAREAMKPVLAMAKMLAPKDTGDLARTIWIEARRPNKRDQKSKYASAGDTVIALVTTKPFPKKKRKEFFAANVELYKRDKEAYRKKFKQYAYSLDFPYDARAIAQEFGTANQAGTPFLRTALESNATRVASSLGEIIGRRIEQYRAKNVK